MLRPTAISVTVQKDYTLKVIFNNGECFWQDLFVGFGQIKIHNLANYIL